jgi:cyclopropane fatty-acyl-phospholipid synthase-like methyltransferase
MKPYSEASERNREPILAVLRRWLTGPSRVLEIGSGTGQHAVFFAGALPHVVWQASDRAENLPGIRQWIEAAALPNLPRAIALDVNGGSWPKSEFDAVYSSNTAHIMSWLEVERMFPRAVAALRRGGLFFLYGPFSYGGRHTADSNARFDASLRAQAAHMGVRDFAALDACATACGFALVEDNAMPANNRLLVWRLAADPAIRSGGDRS